MKIDVCIVCGRRPDLLERTIKSFSTNLFSNFDINNFIVNLDPFAGSVRDHDTCKDILEAAFGRRLVLFEPETCSFSLAVRRVWASSTAKVVFHMEDDWLLNEPILPAQVLPHLGWRTKAVRLVSEHSGWKGKLYKYNKVPRRKMGLKYRYRSSVFGTSPGFWDGKTARRCAALIDPALDPEKQMDGSYNPQLRRYLNRYRCRFLPGQKSDFIIADIGREWRDGRGLIKTVKNARSEWVYDRGREE